MEEKFADDFKDSGGRREFDSGAVRDKVTGKGRFVLISPVGLKRLAVIYEKGCIKYDARNWEKGMPISEFIDSAARHINEYLAGERSEDNLAMAAWNLFAAMHMEEKRPDLMDIPARAPLFNMPKLRMTKELVEDMKTMPPGVLQKLEPPKRRPAKRVKTGTKKATRRKKK